VSFINVKVMKDGKTRKFHLMDELETRRYGYRKSTNQKINMEKKMDESGKKG
jgi:hypothetical protein